MLKSTRFVAAVSVVLLALTTACSQSEQTQDTSSAPKPPKSTASTDSSVAPKASKASSSKPSSASKGDRFQNALDTGMSAAQLTQSAKSKEDWNVVVSRWQSAIKSLKAVPKSSQNHAKAQKKLTEYQKYLAYAQQQAKSGAKPTSAAKPSSSATPQLVNMQDAFDTAMGAAVIAQSAQSKDDWTLVASRWQSAINLLKAVPASSPNYAIAQKKIAEYQRNLSYAQQQQKGGAKPATTVSAIPTGVTISNKTSASAAAPEVAVSNSSAVAPEVALALYLKQKGAKMYGAYWCPACENQKQRFGEEAFSQIKYIECDPAGENARRDLCRQAKIRAFPTWEIDGRLYEPGSYSLETLAAMSGYQGDRNFSY